jgi:hypothetical protein
VANTRYLDFVEEWKQYCLQAKEDYAADPDNVLWEMRNEIYGSTIEKWCCGCPSFQKSPYHLCKHLIRLYIGAEGLESNKPKMPLYGEVWRQTTTPILWIHGVHDVDLLKVRDLRSNSGLPLLTRYLSDDERLALRDQAPTNPVEFETPPECLFDSSDEEEIDGQDEDEAIADENGIEGLGMNQDTGEFEEGLEDVEFMLNEMKGERIKEKAKLLERRIGRLTHTLQEIQKYPSAHRHLQEIPELDGSVDHLLTWCERRERVGNARVLPTTFGRKRRGNVFM